MFLAPNSKTALLRGRNHFVFFPNINKIVVAVITAVILSLELIYDIVFVQCLGGNITESYFFRMF